MNCDLIIEKLKTNDFDDATRLLRLWAIAQLNYRNGTGEAATDLMKEIADAPAVEFIFLLTGLFGQLGVCGPITEEKLLKFAQGEF